MEEELEAEERISAEMGVGNSGRYFAFCSHVLHKGNT